MTGEEKTNVGLVVQIDTVKPVLSGHPRGML